MLTIFHSVATDVFVANNELTGSIPSQLGLLSSLVTLDLSKYCGQGQIAQGLVDHVYEVEETMVC